jgi:hypothetical protein
MICYTQPPGQLRSAASSCKVSLYEWVPWHMQCCFLLLMRFMVHCHPSHTWHKTSTSWWWISDANTFCACKCLLCPGLPRDTGRQNGSLHSTATAVLILSMSWIISYFEFSVWNKWTWTFLLSILYLMITVYSKAKTVECSDIFLSFIVWSVYNTSVQYSNKLHNLTWWKLSLKY